MKSSLGRKRGGRRVDGGWPEAPSDLESLRRRAVSLRALYFPSLSDNQRVNATMPTGALDAAESPVPSLLSMSKSFGPTKALENVDLVLRRGEVVALLGANGAGKSTLAKIASGVVEPDQGQMLINGRPVRFSSPRSAREHGVVTVHQATVNLGSLASALPRTWFWTSSAAAPSQPSPGRAKSRRGRRKSPRILAWIFRSTRTTEPLGPSSVSSSPLRGQSAQKPPC
jgi:hypothetical protein